VPVPRLALLVVTLPLLLGSGATRVPYPMPPDETTERWVSDLAGEDRSDRSYAARVLRSRVRVAVRQARRSDPGSLTHDEALATLDTFDVLVVPACLQALGARRVVGPCADILGLLTVPAASGPLEALLGAGDAPGWCTRHRIERALRRIREAIAPPSGDPS